MCRLPGWWLVGGQAVYRVLSPWQELQQRRGAGLGAGRARCNKKSCTGPLLGACQPTKPNASCTPPPPQPPCRSGWRPSSSTSPSRRSSSLALCRHVPGLQLWLVGWLVKLRQVQGPPHGGGRQGPVHAHPVQVAACCRPCWLLASVVCADRCCILQADSCSAGALPAST